MANEPTSTLPGIILAGGQSSRMGGVDKALAQIGNDRMIDLVQQRLAGQVGNILISGADDRGTGLSCIRDRPDGPKGPAAGLFAAWAWLSADRPAARGFITVPVDGPCFPADLAALLSASGAPAIAADEAGTHPTFGYWPLVALGNIWPTLDLTRSLSLHRLAQMAGASEVRWPGSDSFININTPEELAAMRHQRDTGAGITPAPDLTAS